MPFYGIHFIGVFSFYVTKNTKYVLYSYLIALAVKVVFNFIFVPYYGIYGATFVNLLSFFVMAFSIYLFSKKNYYFNYEWYKIFIMMLIYSAGIIPFFTMTINNRIIELLLKGMVFLFFPFILYIFRFYEPIEIQYIKGFIIKYLLKRNK
jgi:O-antigen/teichoic acid export membrane protein